MPTFQTKAEQDQYDKTLAMFGGVPQGLKDLGYASADPLEVAGYNQDQVSFLSTENAANTVQTNKNKLDVNYPIQSAIETKPTDTKPKTLKFVNDNQQVITLTEDQMYDQDMVDKLTQGGYVFSEGDGAMPPTTKTNKIKQGKTGYWSTSNGVRKWNDTSGTGLGPNGESKIEMEAQEAQARRDAAVKEFNNWTADADPGFQPIVASIKSQFEGLRIQAQKTNESRAKAYETLGMRGGTSEFAGGVQMSIEGGELDQANARLAEITRQEQVAIAAAREAYTTGKWAQFNKQIDLLEKQREEKMALLKDYNDTLATQMNDLREKERVSNTEIGVATAIANGETDPLSVWAYVKSLGIDTTSAEVSDLVKNLTGNYGSGIIGEYNFYKSEEKAQGREPLSFDAYQTRDANRKIAAASANASVNGLNTSQLAALDKKNTWLASQPVVKDFQTVQGKYMDVIKAIKQNAGAADLATIYDLMKSLDPNSVVRESEYETGAKYSGNIFAGAYAKYNGYINPKGGFISPSAKVEIEKLLENLYSNKRQEYTNIRGQVVKDLQNRMIGDAEDYVYDYDLHADVINEQSFSEDDLKEFYQKNPEIQDIVDKIITENPSLSPYEIYQIANAL